MKFSFLRWGAEVAFAHRPDALRTAEKIMNGTQDATAQASKYIRVVGRTATKTAIGTIKAGLWAANVVEEMRGISFGGRRK